MELVGMNIGSYEFINNEKRVAMSEWKAGAENFETSVATCLILAAINSETKNVLLGHFSDVCNSREPNEDEEYTDQDIFNYALEYLKELGPLSKTKIVLAGAGCLEECPDVIEDREYAEAILNAYTEDMGIPTENISICWSDGVATDVKIDRSTDEILIENFTHENVVQAEMSLLKSLGLNSIMGSLD